MTERTAKGTPSDAPSDTSLLRLIRTGNDDAATKLYVRYAKRLRMLARANTPPGLGRRVDVDDIVQSVFRIFFEGANQGLYDVPAGEDLWKLLFVLALNKIRDSDEFHRAAKRDVRATADLHRMDPTDEPEADEDFAFNFLRLVVRDTLALLRPNQREVLELRMEGYEVPEIASQVGRTKRSVERNLQRARARLKSLLDEE